MDKVRTHEFSVVEHCHAEIIRELREFTDNINNIPLFSFDQAESIIAELSVL
jgi:hypothetical protein